MMGQRVYTSKTGWLESGGGRLSTERMRRARRAQKRRHHVPACLCLVFESEAFFAKRLPSSELQCQGQGDEAPRRAMPGLVDTRTCTSACSSMPCQGSVASMRVLILTTTAINTASSTITTTTTTTTSAAAININSGCSSHQPDG
eukprot:246402-Chlamydomonas_euryale.AAC.5